MSRSIQTLAQELSDGSSERLLLFDIDGTLVDTQGKGLRALQRAAAEIFGSECPPLDLAGSTDLGVIEKLFHHYQREATSELTHDFFECYHGHLDRSLDEDRSIGRVLEGVVDLLNALSEKSHNSMGILTGNTMSGADIKLRHYQLDAYFDFGAYGSDRADRNQLGWIALERAHAFTGRLHSPTQTIVIGDTPKDIACAHAIGASCLAVATGHFTEEQLVNAGADWVISSLFRLREELS